ncbi:MAG TPA: MFS transporter, partial [Phycisphaerales bacterium]|nr:MFS transporter [Phycisphaerales bacterium]
MSETNAESIRRQVRQARSRFVAMAATYSLGVFNDNFFKQAASLMAVYAGRQTFQSAIAAAFTLPFLLLAAPAGWLADRFPKRTIVIASKGMELAAMACGAVGIATESWPLVLVMMFLMGAQSTLFSPALN